MEYRILGMPRNVCLGLGYLIWPLALIAALVERRKANREDRVLLWSSVMSVGACYALDLVVTCIVWIPVAGWILSGLVYAFSVVVFVFAIIAAVKCFKGQFADATIPYITDIVDKRVH